MKNLLLPLLLFPLILYGQDYPLKPTNYVTSFDLFHTKNFALNQQEEELLNAKLRAFHDSTGIQLLVYVVKFSIGQEESYSQKVFDAWGMGQTKNTALLTIFSSDKKFIVLGNGLEAILPFEICMEILDEEMKPHFKDENFYQAIDVGIDKLLYYSKHQYEPPSLLEKIKKSKMEIVGVAVLTLPFIMGIIGFLLKNRRRD